MSKYTCRLWILNIKKGIIYFYKKRISLLLDITKLNLAFRVRNHLYLFNPIEGELKEAPSLSAI